MKRKVGERIEYFSKKVVKSPLSGASMVALFLHANENTNSLPIAIAADLNLPSALHGQNYVHGLSVLASMKAGLKLLKVVLAQQGVTAEELDKLSLAEATLDSVTLTFLYEAASPEKADLRMEVLSTLLRKMFEGKLEEVHRENRTLYIYGKDFYIRIYNKKVEDRVTWEKNAPKDLIRMHGKRLIRLEIILSPRFLKARGLHQPQAWSNAASNGLYKRLFDETVGKTLRLNESLRQNTPRPSDLDKLTPTQRGLVKSYLAGEDPRQHSTITGAADPIDAFSKYRLAILGVVKIDINIPWERHRAIRHLDLRRALAYPPLYEVDPKIEDWCFCRASCAATHASLDAALMDAISRANISKPRRAVSVLDDED